MGRYVGWRLVCGLQSHDFGIVSTGHSLGDAASARQMTERVSYKTPEHVESAPAGSLRVLWATSYDLENQM